RARVEAGHLAVDRKAALGGVAAVAACRHRGDLRDLAPADDEEHLSCLVDLEMVARIPGRRRARDAEPRPDGGIDDPRARQSLDLLEGVDRVEDATVEDGAARNEVAERS